MKSNKNGILKYGKEIITAVTVGVLVTLASSYFISLFEGDEPLDGQQQTMNAGSEYALTRAMLGNVIGGFMPVKMFVTEYYMDVGSFPESNKDLDLSMFDLEETKEVDHISWNGPAVVKIDLSQDFGDTKHLEFRATMSRNKAMIKWDCATNLSKKYFSQSFPCETSVN